MMVFYVGPIKQLHGFRAEALPTYDPEGLIFHRLGSVPTYAQVGFILVCALSTIALVYGGVDRWWHNRRGWGWCFLFGLFCLCVPFAGVLLLAG